MSWTYTHQPSLPLDRVRFETGDTNSANPWTLQDSEILWSVSQYPGNILLAAAVCADAIVSKLKDQSQNKTVGDLSRSYNSGVLLMYTSRAYQLRQRAALVAVQPYVGGASLAEKAGVDSDADRVGTAAKVDGMTKTKPENDSDATTGV